MNRAVLLHVLLAPALLLAALAAGWAGAQTVQTVQVEQRSAYGSELRGVVPGDGLDWEIEEIRVLLALGADAPVELQIYSPGFDPDDYRAGADGRPELGDERYDGGAGTLEGSFVLERDGEVLAAGDYAVEPHRWVSFYRGDLEAGAYLLRTRFRGNAKNAFVTRVVTPDPGVASLSFDAGVSLFDVRSDRWTSYVEIDLPASALPARYALYDGDGAGELEARLELPGGGVRPLPVSGDLEWITWQIDQPGRYRVAFRLADGATQYSNTVALRELFPEPVTTEVVREDGTPLPFDAEIEGYAERRVTLEVPPAWRLLRLETDGGERVDGDDATALRFGFGGGHVRYVLTAAPARLRVEAELALPGETRPYPLRFELDGAERRLPASGAAEFELPAGETTVTPRVEGAAVDGPQRVTLRPGETTVARFTVRPAVRLAFEIAPREVLVGDRVRLVAVADTTFPDLLPGDLALALPATLRPLATPRRAAPLASGRPLRLELEAEALEPGRHDAAARLAPWGLEATDAVTVLAPPRLQLDKTALTPTAAVGDTARWRVTVRNDGGVPAAGVRVTDPLAAGLDGTPLDATVTLEPAETRTFEVAAVVTDAAPERLRNRARARYGGALLEAEAELRVLRPAPTLERALDRALVVPGETVTVTLRAGNAGGAALDYTLRDTPPEWLEPLGPVAFEGTLEPGGEAEHRYRARVRFGPAARAAFEARLDWRGGELRADAAIERRLVGLAKATETPRILEGERTAFTVRVANPLPRPLTLTLRESPDAGLGLDAPDELALDLAAGETRELRFPARPDRLGTLTNEVSVWVEGVPAALPARAEVAVLPPLVPERRSTVTLPFDLDVAAVRLDALLLRHELPAGAAYLPGSSRLDGAPLADPWLRPATADAPAALYWRLEPSAGGVVSYRLRHEAPLPELAEPALTARLGERELQLQGDAGFADLTDAEAVEPGERDGVIRDPLPGTVFREVDQTRVVVEAPLGTTLEVRLGGEALPEAQLGEITTDPLRGVRRLAWYGLPLEPGRTVIEATVDGVTDRVEVVRAGAPVRLELRPVAAAADGLQPVELEIHALDAAGVRNGFGALTVATDLEPTEPDAFPDLSGYQLLLRDGRATLRLRPVPSPRGVRVRAAFNRLELDETLFLGGADRTLWQLQGSATARLDGGAVTVDGVARGYLEAPLGAGTVQGALDTAGGIAPRSEPAQRFPTTGSGGDAQAALRSDDLVALRYDDARFTVGYWADPIDLPALPGLADATALRGAARLDAGGGTLSVDAFGALLPSDTVELELVPDGTRRYTLGTSVKPGSERVTLRVGADARPLERLSDYTLDADAGILTLAEPLWPRERGQEVRLRVRATRADAARDTLAYGVGARYRAGDWQLALGAARHGGVQLGAELGYRAAGTAFGVRWRTEGGASRVGIDAALQRGPFEATLDLAAELGDAPALRGRARVAAEVADGHTVALEHRAAPGRDRSDAFYELSLGDVDLGVGVGYGWQRREASALGRVGWNREAFGVDLTHAQGIGAGAASNSELRAHYRIDPNLTARAGLDYRWGGALNGTVGLEQQLGDANLALSYQLPGADGRGNRARFGVAAPLPLGGGFALDLSGDLEHGFGSGDSAARGSFAVRYRSEPLSATLGVDTAWDERDDAPFRVVLRAGASGRIGAQQTLAFDANYRIVPETEGSFTLSYALRGRDLSLLSYHRLSTGDRSTLEGEVAPTVHPDPRWQLRPALAYRLYLDDPSRNLYQLSLGAHLYPLSGVGVGGALHRQWQPGTGSSWSAASLEGSVRIVEEAWLVLGTTFTGFDGLTADTRSGIYLRLDALTGSRR